jgi:hypothetical protein
MHRSYLPELNRAFPLSSYYFILWFWFDFNCFKEASIWEKRERLLEFSCVKNLIFEPILGEGTRVPEVYGVGGINLSNYSLKSVSVR